jgi:predicted DNA repair protein MutK
MEVLSIIALLFCLLLLGCIYVCFDEIDKLNQKLKDKTKDEEYLREVMQKTLLIQQRLCEDKIEMNSKMKGITKI